MYIPKRILDESIFQLEKLREEVCIKEELISPLMDYLNKARLRQSGNNK